jgi:hypothetical protein
LINRSVVGPEVEGSCGPATIATRVRSSVTVDKVLLRQVVERTVLNSVLNLSGTSRHESPAGTTSTLILDCVHDTPVSPIDFSDSRSVGRNETGTRVGLILATRLVVKGTVGVSAVGVGIRAGLTIKISGMTGVFALAAGTSAVFAQCTAIAAINTFVGGSSVLTIIAGNFRLTGGSSVDHTTLARAIIVVHSVGRVNTLSAFSVVVCAVSATGVTAVAVARVTVFASRALTTIIIFSAGTGFLSKA